MHNRYVTVALWGVQNRNLGGVRVYVIQYWILAISALVAAGAGLFYKLIGGTVRKAPVVPFFIVIWCCLTFLYIIWVALTGGIGWKNHFE